MLVIARSTKSKESHYWENFAKNVLVKFFEVFLFEFQVF